MTATEACSLTRDLTKLTFLERVREIWICGKINETIRNAAKRGENYIIILFSSDFGKRIAKRINQYYTNEGYDTYLSYIGFDGWDRDENCPHIKEIKLGIGWRGVNKDA